MAEWFDGLDAETLAHAEAKGWKDADAGKVAIAAIRAHAGAEKLIGHPADQVLKLPKDAADPAFQAVYDRVSGMVTPTKPEDYVFGEGTKEEDAAFVRQIAVEQKLTLPAARAFAAGLAGREAATAATSTAAAETTKAANRAFIVQNWGADFDRKSFSATSAATAAGLPATILTHLATLPQAEYLAGMNSLVALGEKMGEAAMLRGGLPLTPDASVGKTPPEAQAWLNTRNDDKAWTAKYFAGDTATLDEWNKMCAIVAGGRVPPR